jgi:glutamate synthase (NADPH/NADH) large chain
MKEQGEQSLYVPSMEHDSCGIGFIASLKNQRSHSIIENALDMLENMEHRGGTGYDPASGDGAGVLIQIPHQFFSEECKKLGFELPEFGKYGVGMVYFPAGEKEREFCRVMLYRCIDELGFELLGYRTVPKNTEGIGASSLTKEPSVEQIFVKHKQNLDGDTLERKLFVLRNYSQHLISKTITEDNGDFYFVTFSHRVICYKGQFTTFQVRSYFPDLTDPRSDSSLAMIHSRFSTNTFPKWKLAQPFRFIAHNGEINTIRGNVNWTKSHETIFESSLFTREEIRMLTPVCDEALSDSANLDNMIEMLVHAGRSLPHALMMLIPEAYQENPQMPDYKKAFYEYHAGLMEPWDGPASVCFTDGRVIGATLDRNGLRPSRYCITDDGLIIMSSEAGALPVAQSKIVKKGRLQPGRMFIADLQQGRIISDEELKLDICNQKPYRTWLKTNECPLETLPKPETLKYKEEPESLFTRQQAYGFNFEDFKVVLSPMFAEGKEAIGSMGADIPLACLSEQSQHLSNYFKQLFAQVSNPPIDPIRERMVMSLNTAVGRTFNILSQTPAHARNITMKQPVLTNEELEAIRDINHADFRCKTLNATFIADGKSGRLEEAIDQMCAEADRAIIDEGVNILLISDREIDEQHAPIPSLLATGAIHHHLIKNGLRVRVGIVVEAGDVRETHHFATIIGYGGNAINPYMVMESLPTLREMKLLPEGISDDQAKKLYIKSIGGGLLKIFSKMGISTLQSYHGAQIFEAIGIGKKVIDKCFRNTVSRVGGLDFDGIALEVLIHHKLAFSNLTNEKSELEQGGVYQWKRRGEEHLFNPETITLLQQSTRRNDYQTYKEYAKNINDPSNHPITLRGLLDIDFSKRKPIPIEEVEPKEAIFKRFATGAMSFGSISHEVHSAMAIAMNRIGGKSNSGEGGEDPIRFEKKANGDWERSAIKQVASGRFGVTSYYLANAEELQIKMAQGAKPGEGGQLPGDKVDEWIGRVRHSTPGVGLISPPPHHDIYSIEDLAQLIFDLKNANQAARISVKLVSAVGVGTVAAGVAKTHADVVLIAGHDGGTGASPISSIQHTGIPWELGLAESHQTLVRNNLRSRITVQADGQLRTGRDLAIATLLGAEEWGIATAALVVEGCIMMRKCHKNTCPVGVATQNKELRKRFKGKPEYLVNFFTFLAEELREYMAQLGFRSINEMVGQVDCLKMRENIDNWKVKTLDLSPILYKEPADASVGLYKQIEQQHGIENVLDRKLIAAAKTALEEQKPVKGDYTICNVDRTVGAMLSNEISKRYKGEGLPDDTIHFKFRGSAGQSFGGFSAKGLTLELEGEANDYFGKGLSGAKLIVYPDREAGIVAQDNIIIGNVAFYGATSGEAYIRGLAGERFCVRNSGVKAVVEGIGDHGCEYMTGGIAIILGPTGRNFAAGMSGGIAYVFDKEKKFNALCNKELIDFEELDLQDIKLLKEMISNHFEYTKSEVAQDILNNWTDSIYSFVKVMPRDYKKALAKLGV